MRLLRRYFASRELCLADSAGASDSTTAKAEETTRVDAVVAAASRLTSLPSWEGTMYTFLSVIFAL